MTLDEIVKDKVVSMLKLPEKDNNVIIYVLYSNSDNEVQSLILNVNTEYGSKGTGEIIYSAPDNDKQVLLDGSNTYIFKGAELAQSSIHNKHKITEPVIKGAAKRILKQELDADDKITVLSKKEYERLEEQLYIGTDKRDNEQTDGFLGE